MVTDVGLLYWERGELQNGADSAALAVAQECAVSPDTCTAEADAIATEYAGGNANDGLATAEIPTSTFIIDGRSGTVTVDTSTLTDDGSTLRHPLASVVGLDPTTVRADATAEWGTPIAGETIPLAISQCELDTRLASLDSPTTSRIILRSDRNAGNCTSGQPGGFGWLADTDCSVEFAIGGEMTPLTTGNNSNGTGCDDDPDTGFLHDHLGTTILVPLYNTGGGTGAHGGYFITKFAAFYLTGYREGGASSTRYLGGTPLSPVFGAGEKGIQGYFVRYVALGEDFELGDGGDGGLMIVRLTN
ncbi:hypothetical protein ASE14_14085 [Agromyces sp. Root81]|nr:hypothetical protein ASE14_14085 [Agromyces sp. Root81]